MNRKLKIRIHNNKIFDFTYYCPSRNCKIINNTCCFKYYTGVSRYKRILIEELLLSNKNLNMSRALIRETYFSHFDKTGAVNIKNNNEGCSFLYKDEKGFYRCRIHSLCLDRSLNPFRYKPVACMLWPLIVFKYDGMVSLDVYEEYSSFPCSRDQRGLSLIVALRPQLEYILGENTYQQLQQMQLSS